MMGVSATGTRGPEAMCAQRSSSATRPSRFSVPVLAASTMGPFFTARYCGTLSSSSIMVFIGRDISTMSPFFHLRSISMYDCGVASAWNAFPLILILYPASVHSGQRMNILNFFDFLRFTVILLLSSNGKLVSCVIVALFSFQLSLDATNRFTLSSSAPSWV